MNRIVITICLVFGMMAANAIPPPPIPPPPSPQAGHPPEKPTKNTITVQASWFDWHLEGVSARTGIFVSGNFELNNQFSIGGWFSADHQSSGGATSDLNWFEAYGTWYPVNKPTGALGLSYGLLGVDFKDVDTFYWNDLSIVGSVPLAKQVSLSASFGWLAGQKSSSGLYQARDGYSYGAGLSYRVTRQFSVEAMAWIMKLNGEGGANIYRYTAGLGYHF